MPRRWSFVQTSLLVGREVTCCFPTPSGLPLSHERRKGAWDPAGQTHRRRSPAEVLGGALYGENLLPDGAREVHKHEIALVVQVVLAAFVDNAYEIILGSFGVRLEPIDLAEDEGCLIVGVINA